MRRRKATLISLGALVALIIAGILLFRHFAPPPGPQVRLLTFGPSKGFDPQIVRTQYDSLFAAVPTLIGEEISVAQFEIAFPQESGSTVRSDIGYEIYDANAEIIDKGVLNPSLRFSASPFMMQRRSFAIRPKFVLPHHARGVRLGIWFRPPTLRERSQMFFQKIGFRIRYPKVADAISKLIPNSERSLKHDAEIELPPFPSGKPSTAALQTKSTVQQQQ